jgi:hypothetical protein
MSDVSDSVVSEASADVRSAVGGRIVDQENFEILVCLVEHALDSFREKIGPVERGYDHADRGHR